MSPRPLYTATEIPSGPFSEASWAICRFTEAARRLPTNANTLMSVMVVFLSVLICQTDVTPADCGAVDVVYRCGHHVDDDAVGRGDWFADGEQDEVRAGHSNCLHR